MQAVDVTEVIKDETLHSVYSASSGERWINCPASIQMVKSLPSWATAADEALNANAWAGTVAHELAYRDLALAEPAADSVGKIFSPEEGHELEYKFTEQDFEYLDVYIDSCRSDEAEEKFYEVRVDYSGLVKGQQGFGTADYAAVSGSKLKVKDLKFGLSQVDSVTQLKLYALGMLDDVMKNRFIDEVELTIIQPRIGHTLTVDVPSEDLYEWAKNVVEPAVESSLADDPDFNVNVEGWCHFCPAKSFCRPWAEEVLSRTAKDFNGKIKELEVVDKDILTIEEQAEIFAFSKTVSKQEPVLKRLLIEAAKEGLEVPGHKLVFWNDTNYWLDEDQAFRFLIDNGLRKDDIIEEKLISVAEAKKLVRINSEDSSSLIGTKKGNLTLALNSTRRKKVTKDDLDKLAKSETEQLEDAFKDF